ncbi:MAG: endonuclease V [Candidatus Binatia bacterium]|nr:endonuclease V [Candidatus Binatia bacterium]
MQLQKELRCRVRTNIPFKCQALVGVVDVAYLPREERSIASIVVLSYDGLARVKSAVARSRTPFPYVPGLLSFREIPVILEAIEKLSALPDLIYVDGHGQAHPRRFGIASHLGLWLKHPTIGIGKSRLCDEFREPDQRRGAATNLIHRREVIDRVLRTRKGVKPIFVSAGYGLPLEECVRWTLAVTPRFRLPEPIRQAD